MPTYEVKVLVTQTYSGIQTLSVDAPSEAYAQGYAASQARIQTEQCLVDLPFLGTTVEVKEVKPPETFTAGQYTPITVRASGATTAPLAVGPGYTPAPKAFGADWFTDDDDWAW